MACIVVIAATTAGGEPAAAAPSTASARSAAKVSDVPHLMRTFGHSRSAASTAAASTAAARALTNGGGPLVYQGGPVQVQPKVYLDFWGVEWTNGTPDTGGYDGATAQRYIVDFLRDISGSPWFNSQTHYCDGIAAGATSCPGNAPHVGTPTFAGNMTDVWNDPSTPVPTDSGIFGEAIAAANHFTLRGDVDATVLVLTPTNQSYFFSQGQGFCGYHGASAGTSVLVFGYIPWAPDQGTSCATNAVNANDSFGHGHFDGFSAVIGHEVAEAATDPQPGYVNNQPAFGWIDGSGLETGDKCQNLSTWPMRNAYFGAGNTNFYAVQPLWSNAGASCPLEDLGGLSPGHAAVASWAASRRDVFVRGGDNALWYRRWDGTGWSGWASLGGFLTSAPSAISWGVGRTDVFVRGGDNALWHIAWTGSSWSAWQWLGGILLSGPGAASWTSGGLDVVAVGGDRAMWHARLNGTIWSGWESLGGVITSDPSAVSWRDGTDRVDVFARGQDGQLWQDTWSASSWHGWLPRGGVFTGGPGVTSTSPGQLQVYGIGQDNALWHETFHGAWSSWSSLAGQWSVDPTAISPPSSGAVELFMIGTDAATDRLIEGP